MSQPKSICYGFPALVLLLAASPRVAAQAAPPTSVAQDERQTAVGNKPERVEWFRRLGFGLFIHWSLDSQLGSVISHSLVGADEEYRRRYFEDLPKTFNPRKLDPDAWADLFKLSGARYVVFTAKHHSGFCMFDTATTEFNITNTPYAKDITGQLIEALRRRGIAVGLYFSPDDFWFLHQQGIAIQRNVPEVAPANNPGLMNHDQAQLRELLTGYGPIDILFIDGPAEGLRELAWKLQPNLVITRGAMKTPEQYIPGTASKDPWESCITMGTQWQYKPTNETYKSGDELIRMLIETRAKGGNLLLNLGPKPDGEIPVEQEARLREIALWNFINAEAVGDIEPWLVPAERSVMIGNDKWLSHNPQLGTIWLTKRRGEDTVYAIVSGRPWGFGQRREIVLGSVKAGEKTRVSLLSQTGKVLEYRPKADVATRWKQDDDGLHISAVNAQRIYNDHKWPNPIVIKVTDAHPALDPPVVTTGRVEKTSGGAAVLTGELATLGDLDRVEVGFLVRPTHESTQPLAVAQPWQGTYLIPREKSGPFRLEHGDLEPGRSYEYRAVVVHWKITLFGDVRKFTAR